MRKLVMAAGVLLAMALAEGAVAAPRLSDAEYLSRIRGAWLGKCIGGALGMPLEGWRHADIVKRYPKITGYVGYFDDGWAGWTGIHDAVTVPKDGGWHQVEAVITAPAFDEKRTYLAPIVGLSLEYSTTPAAIEVRGIDFLAPNTAVAFDGTSWAVSNSCGWTAEGAARFDFNGERAWLKLKPSEAHRVKIRPGERIRVRVDARWISGDNRLGVAFDVRNRAKQVGFGPDDDTSYQIVGLDALERFGPDLSCTQIGQVWCERLPAIDRSLAEGLALERMRSGIVPPKSGEHPIGEAIGGQMKGEIWGLIAPNRPDLAAEYARRDGVVAHQRNGVYGEMFVAAMISQSFSEKDPRKLIEVGLRQVPADSQYHSVAVWVLDLCKANTDYTKVLAQIVAKYPGVCDPVFAEEGIVILSLYYGRGDFGRSIEIAASCGNDTDCNTATVGALLGCIHGDRGIPARWKAPIGDTFRCFVKGLEDWKISALAERIGAAGRKVLKHHGAQIRFGTEV